MKGYHKNSDTTILKINKAYDKAIKDINEDINSILINFKLSSKQSDKDVMQLLNSHISAKELKSIRDRVNYITDEELKQYMLAQLNSRPYKARITRLEALKESIYINCKQIANTELKESTKLYTSNINNAYYKNIFDIQKGLGVGFNFAEMSKEVIEEILKSKWSGNNYSKLIWNNTDVLTEKLEEVITSGLMQGKSSRRMALELEELSRYGKFASERLVRTETTYVTNMAEIEGYKELGIEEYIFIATLDTRTSKQCREHDMKVYKVNEAVAGENLPPLHPHCRSTTVANLGEENLNNMKRRARDTETGKTYIIDGNTTYNE